MELSGPFAGLAQGLLRLLTQAASAVVLVVLGWKFLAVLLTGGSDRAMKGLIVSLVIVGVCVAALANLNQTAGIVLAVGQAVWAALAEAVRGSV